MTEVADQATPFSTEPQEPAPFTEQTPAQPAPTQQTSEQVQPQQPSFDVPDPAKDWIGEGKKWSSVEEALKAIPHAQQHISTLESELNELREKVDKGLTMEELLQEVKSTTSTVPEQSAPQIDESLIDRIVEQKITAKEQAATAQQNVNSVVSKMTEAYGDQQKAEQMYVDMAQKVGLPVSTLNDMAAKSPTAVFHLFGLTDSKEAAPAGKTHPSVNTEASHQSQQPPVNKPVMGGASHSDIIDAWKAAAPKQE